MLTFTIDTVSHPTNGRFAAQIYYPTDPSTLLWGSDYIYRSPEAAEAEVIAIIKKTFPNDSIKNRT